MALSSRGGLGQAERVEQGGVLEASDGLDPALGHDQHHRAETVGGNAPPRPALARCSALLTAGTEVSSSSATSAALQPSTSRRTSTARWRAVSCCMSEVPLAEDLVFLGPVASFETAEGYRAMARQAGAAVTSFRVRHQFADGDLVCSIVDWTMQPVPGTLSAAEILEIRDGRIVRGELFYDAEELRKAMAGGTSG